MTNGRPFIIIDTTTNELEVNVVGLRDKLFGKRPAQPVEIPAILQPENPVNYDSVLDYLVGLDQKEYDKMLKVTGIYREANKQAAKVLGVKDQPTTQLKSETVSEDEFDQQLDQLLETDPADLRAAMENEELPGAPKKPQSPSNGKKVTVNGK